MRVLAVVNQKGGCGKTTISLHLASAWAKAGQRVLLVDLDSQGHASLGLGVRFEDLDFGAYDLLSNPALPLGDLAVSLDDNLDLIPGGIMLSAFEQEMSGQPGRENRLLSALLRHAGSYDTVLIDTPPSVGLLTINALVAASALLVPVDSSTFTLHGLEKVLETMELLLEETGKKPPLFVVANQFDRRTLFSRDLYDHLTAQDRIHLLESRVRSSVRVKQAAAAGVAVMDLAGAGPVRYDFENLAEELSQQLAETAVEDPGEFTELLFGPSSCREGVMFTLLAPDAREVYLTGEFNHWNPGGIPLEPHPARQGVWQIVLPLQIGSYEYRFIVDGRWIADPANDEKVATGVGVENSLVHVS